MSRRYLLPAALVAMLATLSIATATTASACKKCATHNTSTQAAAKEAPHNVAPEGFTALFNGKDLKGWHIKSGEATYDVKDGIITGTTVKGSPNTFLCSDNEYGDFELTFDVLLHDNQLNSGCQVRSQLIGNKEKFGGRLSGPQCEIEASSGQAGYIYGEALSTGWLSPEPKSKDKAVNSHAHFKNGQWNKFRIVAKGNNIKTFINGEPIADLKIVDDIQEKYSQGVIGLQVHSVGGDPKWSVSWRNIYIKELK